ncbi:hypothetical protein A2356_01880 [Candidatus Nomurabacteria bacterium RIFOXYB1_FULL_39_16]|uniref:Lipoprotein n=2 Tax=Candidatus Nomuraibacteriota TaxID=1752729 RepID=A0A0G0QSI5_9BACT|nr:MAG: hypothetical protein UT78_C0008G0035 [Candidatus Nomurabacteria bacterium GW2011_GWF2_40_12]OGJ09106.1 MAG: hypothetical protein A2356_01880 [Candidatus Nomurabacteria bacterium RIFOXYB1_FULL_39_16]OGJ14697.1 MAG: hypothetical protein A2585_02535 [Candidatus Nomurabacteria bacterium RIFOXYD1_FULL_39_12]
MSKKNWVFLILAASLSVLFFNLSPFLDRVVRYNKNDQTADVLQVKNKPTAPVIKPLDTIAYDKKLNEIANNPIPPGPTTKIVKDPKTGVETTITIPPKPTAPNIWPVKTVYPNAGAILPFNRIIAYYGNLYSTKMGVLGEYKEEEMLARLKKEVDKWNTADPNTPVIPALHYIAVVAQGSAGADGKYRARMPSAEIDKVLKIAAKINAIVFLDIQLGFSKVETEVPLLEKYLKLPNVHLGIDPEFSMKGDIRPGKVVGTLDAADINFASNYLANIVKANKLTPKVLVIHRYTQKMVTNYKLINTMPEVQIVMHMDGWGGAAKKINTYQQFVYKEPVQFTGFKLFYKNDVFDPGTVIMTPESLLKLNPRPVYIQYQ